MANARRKSSFTGAQGFNDGTYHNNTNEPVRKTSQYDCALPATASYGGYVRVGFEGIDTPELNVHIREAVLIGYQTNQYRDKDHNNTSFISKRMASATQLDKYGKEDAAAHNNKELSEKGTYSPQPVRPSTPVASHDVVRTSATESSMDFKESNLSDKDKLDTHIRHTHSSQTSHATTTPFPVVSNTGTYSERDEEDSNASGDRSTTSGLISNTPDTNVYNKAQTSAKNSPATDTTPTSASSGTFNRLRKSSIAGISGLIKSTSRSSERQRSASCHTENLYMSSPLPAGELRRKTDTGNIASNALSLDFLEQDLAHNSISELDTATSLPFTVVTFIQGSGRGVSRDSCGKTSDVQAPCLSLEDYINQKHDYLTEDLKADGPLALAKRVARTHIQQQNTQTINAQKNASSRMGVATRAQSTISLVSSTKDVGVARALAVSNIRSAESMVPTGIVSAVVPNELLDCNNAVEQKIGAGYMSSDMADAISPRKSEMDLVFAPSPVSGRSSPLVHTENGTMQDLLDNKCQSTENGAESLVGEPMSSVLSGSKLVGKPRTLAHLISDGIGSVSLDSTPVLERQQSRDSNTTNHRPTYRRTSSMVQKTESGNLLPGAEDSPSNDRSRPPTRSDSFHVNLRRRISDNDLSISHKDSKTNRPSTGSNLSIANIRAKKSTGKRRPKSALLSPNMHSRGSSPASRRRSSSAMMSVEDLTPVVHNPVWDSGVTVHSGWTQVQKDQMKKKQSGEVQKQDSVGSRSTSASTSSSISRWRRGVNLSQDATSRSGAGSKSIAESTESSKTGTNRDKDASHGDYLDRLLGDVSKLVVVVMQGPVAVGEIAIPLRNLTTQEGWFPLVPVSPLHMEGLYKVLKRTNPKGGRRTLLHTDMDDQMVFRNLHRKFVSIRTALMSISGFELLLIVSVTTALVYTVTLSEMTDALKILTKQIWLGLDVGLSREFLLPEVQTVVTAGYFLIPQIQSDNSSTLITSYMLKSFNGTLGMNYTSPSATFVAFPDNKVFMSYLDGNGDDFNNTNSIRMLIQDTNVAPNTSDYGINNTCVELETTAGCEVYNLSDAKVESEFEVADRPWYNIVENTLGPQWTSVYPFVGNSYLGATLSYRVPQDLSQPMKAIVSSDLTLFQMSRILDNQTYYRTGYAVMFESTQGNLLATTSRTEAEGGSLQRVINCSTPGETVLERVRLYDSGNPLLDEMSAFLEKLCLETGECYVDVLPAPPVTIDCNDRNPVVPNDTQCGYPTTDVTVACEPVPAGFQPSVTTLTASTTDTGPPPQVHIMDNGDILAIGFFSLVGGDLVLAVVIPAEDYHDAFQHILRITVAVAVVILIISLIAAAIIAHMVSRRLVECTKNLSRFARLDFSQAVDSQGMLSPLKEIARIYEVMGIIRTSMRSFSKYIPPDVVRLLVQSGLEATLGGQNKLITSFCTDIVNFTTISESLDIDELNTVLGDYLQCMSEIVHENKGTVDKYIGDSIVAMWNAPEIVVDHAHKACESALLCQARLALLREEWQLQGFPALHQRIGIHTGDAIVGNCGSISRLNYTALGNNVDFASRLEADNKKYGTDVLISDVTYSLVRDDFVARPVDDVVMPGLQKRTCRLYELVAHNDTATSAQVLRCERFEKAYTTFHDRKDARAAQRFLHEYAIHHLRRKGLDDIVDPNYDVLKQLCDEELAKPKNKKWSRKSLQRTNGQILVT